MDMKSALIGSTGFVGTTLLNQRNFDNLYHSTDISDINGKIFDFVVCAGAPAQKWYANLHPDEDKNVIDKLISHLNTISAKKFVLISTVDVFPQPIGVDENTNINIDDLQPYGFNRRRLEIFAQTYFSKCIVIRLPGLVGKGLKKNVIFDFKHNNELEKVDSDSTFQFYPMKNLWNDIRVGLEEGLSVLHLAAEPVGVSEIAKKVFGMAHFNNHTCKVPAKYDFRTIHAGLWGKKSLYQYDKEQSLEAIREYAEM